MNQVSAGTVVGSDRASECDRGRNIAAIIIAGLPDQSYPLVP